ncbi:MAG: polyamine aminopropyltransferase [Cyclobacteriaceae bacterium]|nr:polyamine aminopropyltransferase [Cyclobacteriaceae bacterium]
MKLRSNILKLCLFATGLSGIVAEYVLSTLATYFLGNSVLQWTMIVSIMLFSMGLGARITKMMEGHLLEKFIWIEIALSILASLVSLLTYTAATYTMYTGVVIYALCIIIGLLIGMEIPLVIRINDSFETLKINVSSMMEKDYYGSLLGGVFFAFVGLPFLGLTYTPFVLGFVNYAVAIVLLAVLWNDLGAAVKTRLGTANVLVLFVLFAGMFSADRIIEHGEEMRYKDNVIFSKQTKYQKLVITQSHGDYWLFINGNQQLSTVDEIMYHEPLVHPLMKLSPNPTDILILGGGDGCAVREVLKYDRAKNITLVDLDPDMTRLAMEHQVLSEINQNALKDPKVSIINEDGYTYLERTDQYYDVVIVDLPDPKSIELGRLYSYEFYKLCNNVMRPNGLIITQAGSPYFAARAFKCIDKTMEAAGFSTVPLHNQVVTLGEWGWISGAKSLSKDQFKAALKGLDFAGIPTKWINHEAMTLMTSFGKDFTIKPGDSIAINTIHHPVLFQYYMNGDWDLY